MKFLILSCVLAIAGCGYHPQVSVYGRSGAPFTAPSLCAALVQCLNSKETACFYDRDLQQTSAGTQSLEECKEVTK